ncbi:MAG: hypothetical protein SFW67_19080 [Myxococcaceae bacterium]|nr:hypothetical protein [Myxococcaceae bacterium]
MLTSSLVFVSSLVLSQVGSVAGAVGVGALAGLSLAYGMRNTSSILVALGVPFVRGLVVWALGPVLLAPLHWRWAVAAG